MIRHRNRWFALFLAAITVLLVVQEVAGEPLTVRITVLHTNDFHGHNVNTLPRRATLIERIRREQSGGVLLVDAGDVFTRGPYSMAFRGELEFEAMNRMGYDAMTLGNNEFKGAWLPGAAQKVLFNRILQARFEVLCANITSQAASFAKVKPYCIKTVCGLRVAIVGVTSQRVAGYRRAVGFSVSEPVETLRRYVSRLHESGEADVIIALTHVGRETDLRIAREVGGLAAIVGGDSHTVISPPLVENGVVIVQAGGENSGLYLGRLDLEFTWAGGGWTLARHQGGLLRLDRSVPDDPVMRAWLNSYLGYNRPVPLMPEESLMQAKAHE